MIVVNATFRMTFPLEEYEKDSQKHFKAVNSRLFIESKIIKFHFQNIFDNPLLTSWLNSKMEEKSENIGLHWQSTFPLLLIQLFEEMFNKVLGKIPASELIESWLCNK